MGRNRKNGSAARFAPAVKAALICVLIGGSAIGYVYQKNQIGDLGKQIQQRQKILAQLVDENVRREKQRMSLQAGTMLDAQVKRMKLDLVQPAQSQILTIIEVPAGNAAVPTYRPPNETPYPSARRNEIVRAGGGR